MVKLNLLASAALFAAQSLAYTPAAQHYGYYSTVSGFFKQDDNSTEASGFDYTDNLGLHDNLTWIEFRDQIEALNEEAPNNVSYKVIFLARHSEGYHNVAESYYGTPLWNCYYSLLDGNGTSQWGPDAYLTEKGIDNAINNSYLIKSLIADDFPLPQSFYSSPFTRAADTLVLTWADLILDSGYNTPIFKEALRETIGLHTCDKRRSKAYLENRYPDFEFETGFYDEDLLWTKDTQEDDGAKVLRARQFLDDLFASDENTYISVTAHSGVGSAILSAIGHRSFKLATGAIIPLVVRRESILGFTPPTSTFSISIGPSGTAPACSASYSTVPSSVAFATDSLDISSESAPATVTVTVTASA